MSLNSILYSLASVPMFASRPFLAAFLTCLLAKWGAHVPLLGSSDVVLALARSPEWFQSGTCLGVLTLLAAGEALSAKYSEVRAVMAELDGWVKSGMSLFVSLAILDSGTAETIDKIRQGGLSLHSLFAGLASALTFALSSVRKAIFEHLADVDDDDDVGLQSLLSWAENSWTVLGILFLVVFPVVAIVLSALTAAALWWFRRRADAREAQSRVPCAACGTPTLPHALACPKCRAPLAAPRAVGVFGQPQEAAAEDLALHRFNLIARKRCPLCATRLKRRAVRQACPECSTTTFANQAEFQAYLGALQDRLPRTLLISFGLSAIPVVGVIPGVLYYRLAIVSGLRGYIPPLKGCLTRVVVRIIDWVIIALQVIPFVGAFVIPLMCLSTYLIYRKALKDRATEDFTAQGAPAGA